jgi:hypothetical protein
MRSTTYLRRSLMSLVIVAAAALAVNLASPTTASADHRHHGHHYGHVHHGRYTHPHYGRPSVQLHYGYTPYRVYSPRPYYYYPDDCYYHGGYYRSYSRPGVYFSFGF